MRTPHIHAEVIKAWADGADIDWRTGDDDPHWIPLERPSFIKTYQYRVRPVPVTRYRWVATMCPEGTKPEFVGLYVTDAYKSRLEAAQEAVENVKLYRLIEPVLSTERTDWEPQV